MMLEPRWVAMCDDYRSPPYATEQQAERKAAAWDHMGGCDLPHVVVQVAPDTHGVYRYPDGQRVTT